MQLDLTPAEADVLKAVIAASVDAMYAEISHTDNPAYRSSLRAHRDLLRAIEGRLEGVKAS